MASTTLIKKHLIRPFLNKGTSASPEWVQIKKATEFTRTMNATTEDRDYIADEMATTEVTQYKPSEAISITMYKGEDDFDYLYQFYKNRAIGSDAQTEILLVSIFESVEVTDSETSTTTTYYYADKTSCTLVIDELNASSSTLSATVYENGTPVAGYVTISDKGVPTFTAGDMPSAS